MIEIYTRDDCNYCVLAKAVLNRFEIPFVEHRIDKDVSREDVMAKFPSIKTVPVIVVNGEMIGGYTEMMAKINESGPESFGKTLLNG